MLRVLPPTKNTLQPYLLWVVKRATSLFNSFCSNVVRHVALFCCPFYCSLNPNACVQIFYSLQIDCGFEISRHATKQGGVYFGVAHLPSSIPKTTVCCFDCCFFPVWEIMMINLAKERKSELIGA